MFLCVGYAVLGYSVKNLTKQLTFIDLFAGCGGLSLGLEQAGFYPLCVNEINDDALETYLINRDSRYKHLRRKIYSSRDIKDATGKDYFNDLFFNLKKDFYRDFNKDTVDLIVGGPPCQGFSGIGYRRSYSVEKGELPSNHLYQQMAYFIHNIRPKMFLFENVEGILRSRWKNKGRKGSVFADIFKTFRRMNDYSVKFSVVHSKDYGVPQNRPRVLLVGIQKAIIGKVDKNWDAIHDGFLPSPSSSPPTIEDVFSDLVDPKFKNGGETTKYKHKPQNIWQKSIRTNLNTNKILKKGDDLSEHKYSKHTGHVRKRFKHMISHNGEIHPDFKTKKFSQRLLPKKWDKGGPNITVCSLPDDFVHYSQPRSLTVREWARLQTFPDWYEFSGNRTTGGIRRAGNPRASIYEREVPKYTQIGNAVPVKLAFELGKHFKKILENTPN